MLKNNNDTYKYFFVGLQITETFLAKVDILCNFKNVQFLQGEKYYQQGEKYYRHENVDNTSLLVDCLFLSFLFSHGILQAVVATQNKK